MARITVEDCIDKVTNRFELVSLAAQRAKSISSGAEAVVDRDNDKDAVIALREIAEGKVSIEYLMEEMIKHYQKVRVFQNEENLENANNEEENIEDTFAMPSMPPSKEASSE